EQEVSHDRSTLAPGGGAPTASRWGEKPCTTQDSRPEVCRGAPDRPPHREKPCATQVLSRGRPEAPRREPLAAGEEAQEGLDEAPGGEVGRVVPRAGDDDVPGARQHRGQGVAGLREVA